MDFGEVLRMKWEKYGGLAGIVPIFCGLFLLAAIRFMNFPFGFVYVAIPLVIAGCFSPIAAKIIREPAGG